MKQTLRAARPPVNPDYWQQGFVLSRDAWQRVQWKGRTNRNRAGALASGVFWGLGGVGQRVTSFPANGETPRIL